MKLDTKKWKNNYSSEKGITFHKKEEGKHSTIENKCDKFGNKVSMLETSNEVDEEKVTKEKNISFSRILLMIEAEETPPKNTGSLKYEAFSLLNDEKKSKNDQHIEKIRWMGNI